MNKVIISGRVTKDIVVASTGDGTHYCSFSIANNEGYGDKQKTNFVNVSAFGNNADFIGKYFKKGSPILIDGRLSVSSYEDKDGNKRTSINVVVNNVEFMGSKETSEEAKENDLLNDFEDKTCTDDFDLPF